VLTPVYGCSACQLNNNKKKHKLIEPRIEPCNSIKSVNAILIASGVTSKNNYKLWPQKGLRIFFRLNQNNVGNTQIKLQNYKKNE
jgi:hypothetical protein